MYSVAEWLGRHPQFGGGQQGFPGNEMQEQIPAQSAYQNASLQGLQNGQAFQPNLGQGMGGNFNPFRFAMGAANGQRPSGFAAWREKRMAMGLPYTGPQFRQPTEA